MGGPVRFGARVANVGVFREVQHKIVSNWNEKFQCPPDDVHAQYTYEYFY